MIKIISILLLLICLIGCSNYKTCDYCHEKFWEEGTQIKEYWLCEGCWSILDFEASREYRNEYNRKRLKWVYDQIKKAK